MSLQIRYLRGRAYWNVIAEESPFLNTVDNSAASRQSGSVINNRSLCLVITYERSSSSQRIKVNAASEATISLVDYIKSNA